MNVAHSADSVCVNNMVNGEHMAYSKCLPYSGNLEFWYLLDSGCLCDKISVKTLTAESLKVFHEYSYCTYVAAFLLLEEKCTLCDSSWEGGMKHKEAFK